MAILIHSGEVVTPLNLIHDGAVLVVGTRITRVGPTSELLNDPGVTSLIDAGGRIVAPGFIDLQLNGANGRYLTADPTVDTVRAMVELLPRFGCTAVLPTAITAPVERLIAACRAVNSASTERRNGASILGIHLEGPFINPERAGAHSTSYIVEPSEHELLQMWEHGRSSIKLITLAPEIAGSDTVVAAARQLGITVAIGHTSAGPAEIDRAARAGARLVTHLFNAMAPMGSRAPGSVGGSLANDNLFVSVIADGIHVHPVSLRVAVRAKGVDRVVLITDAMPPVGNKDRSFELDSQIVTVRDGACYRPDGVLAGSMLTMDRAVKNMHELVGVSLPEAIAMASLNPARVLGIADRKGSIEPGMDADVVIIDRDVNVWLTMVTGTVCYQTAED